MVTKTVKKTASNIRHLREKQNLSQAALAKKAGLDSNYYAKIDRGDMSPGLDKYEQIAKALGVKSSDIFPF